MYLEKSFSIIGRTSPDRLEYQPMLEIGNAARARCIPKQCPIPLCYVPELIDGLYQPGHSGVLVPHSVELPVQMQPFFFACPDFLHLLEKVLCVSDICFGYVCDG